MIHVVLPAERGAAAEQHGTDCTPSVPRSDPSEIDSNQFELIFELRKDALRFKMFIIVACVFVYLFMIASCVMFFSSFYPVSGAQNSTSAVDFLLVTSHVCAIDISSAFFVVCGFFAAYTYGNVPSTDHADLRKLLAVYALIDVCWQAC